MNNSLMAAVSAAAADEQSSQSVRVVDASAAQIADARAAGVVEGEKKAQGAVADTVKAERARCAILGSDAAKGREAMAAYCAFETDMSADQAVGMLGKAPALEATAPAAAAETPLDRAMARFSKPVGADAQPGAQPAAAIDFAGIYAKRAATVAAFRK